VLYFLKKEGGGKMGFERVDTTANRLKTAMHNAGKKQIDLVREIGIDKGSMSHYLKGRYEPKQDVIFDLAKALNVSEMWLWGYDCPMERPIEQKNNDAMADIIVRMRTDEDFFEAVNIIYTLDDTKFSSVKQMLTLLK
jgi:transcriptional regulator with XRE-family HTH domain